MNELIKSVTASTPAAFSGLPMAQTPVRETSRSSEREADGRPGPGTPSLKELEASIDRMAEKAFGNSRLAIEKHDAAGVFVYRLIDSRNGSVMRQWPSEDFLALREYLRSKQGGLVDERI
ncbi:flagellar protein FlaG [Hyphobacterium sp.]|uniref:flagellar protein FlaG n=1 Tax=Hyphobacterium sp. TaxID=2004662 RepID=UPI00374973EA